MGTLCVQSFQHPLIVRERPESSSSEYFLMNISVVTGQNYLGYASLLQLQLSDLLREEPIVSRSAIEDALSSLHVPSRYHCSIVEKLLRDAKASANGKVLNLWVKVYVDVNDFGCSYTEEDMDSHTEEKDTGSDAEEEDLDLDTEEEEFVCCSICNEEIEVGSEETRLPCTHMYHKDCIVKWLQSTYCQPCQYGMSQQLVKPE